jgi:hypothetical protein
MRRRRAVAPKVDRFWVLPLRSPLTARSIASRGSPAVGTGSELFRVGFEVVSQDLSPFHTLSSFSAVPPLHIYTVGGLGRASRGDQSGGALSARKSGHGPGPRHPPYRYRGWPGVAVLRGSVGRRAFCPRSGAWCPRGACACPGGAPAAPWLAPGRNPPRDRGEMAPPRGGAPSRATRPPRQEHDTPPIGTVGGLGWPSRGDQLGGALSARTGATGREGVGTTPPWGLLRSPGGA